MSQPLDPKAAVVYGALVECAYASYEINRSDLTPKAVGVPPGFTPTAWIQMNDFGPTTSFTQFYGFLFREESDRRFVLALRGTDRLTEWWDNLHCGLVPFAQAPDAGYVSSGFDTIYATLNLVQMNGPAHVTTYRGSFAQQVADAIMGSLPPITTKSQPTAPASVVVVGHSLGAALGTLYIMDNVTNTIITSPLLCTFASPRVGDRRFAEAFNGLGLTSWRIVNLPDWVPQLPFEFLGYAHVNQQTLLDSTGRVKSTLGCWHAMETYLMLLDANLPPRKDCSPAIADENLQAISATFRVAIETA